jgi:hypothetical protein
MQKVEGSNPFSRLRVVGPFPANWTSGSPAGNGSVRKRRPVSVSELSDLGARAYRIAESPEGEDRNFALAGNFQRIDTDSRSISEISEDELMRGFGE